MLSVVLFFHRQVDGVHEAGVHQGQLSSPSFLFFPFPHFPRRPRLTHSLFFSSLYSSGDRLDAHANPRGSRDPRSARRVDQSLVQAVDERRRFQDLMNGAYLSISGLAASLSSIGKNEKRIGRLRIGGTTRRSLSESATRLISRRGFHRSIRSADPSELIDSVNGAKRLAERTGKGKREKGASERAQHRLRSLRPAFLR